MEQRKILWVVFSVALFIIVIFGVALYLYAPFRNKSSMDATTITDLGTLQTDDISVDPLNWTRNPDSIPELEEKEPASVNIQNTITVVNGETEQETKVTGDDESSVSVKTLTNSDKKETETTELPENLAKQIKNDDSKTEKQTETKDAEKKDEKKTVTKQEAKTGVVAKKGSLAPAKKTTVKKTTTEKKLPSKSKTKASKTQTNLSKKVIETLYWVQTASLTSRLNAENARDFLVSKHMHAEIFTKQTTTGLTHRVRVGPFKNKTEAEYWLRKIQDLKGFEKSYVSQARKKN